MEELKGFEENIKMFEENLTEEELEKINMLKEEFSKMDQLTDDEIENIAGGVSENSASNLSMSRQSNLLLITIAATYIRDGNFLMSVKVMRLIDRDYHYLPEYILIREAFREKFKEDPARFGL